MPPPRKGARAPSAHARRPLRRTAASLSHSTGFGAAEAAFDDADADLPRCLSEIPAAARVFAIVNAKVHRRPTRPLKWKCTSAVAAESIGGSGAEFYRCWRCERCYYYSESRVRGPPESGALRRDRP